MKYFLKDIAKERNLSFLRLSRFPRNEKAKELGCEHTHFVTPNGLDSDEHYTTAVELAKIASYAIKNKEFINITNKMHNNY